MMKKFVLIALGVYTLLIGSTFAQNGQYSFSLHDVGEYQFDIENAIRQDDGDIIMNLFVATGPSGTTPTGVGNLLYKMSPVTQTFTDSLLVEDPEPPYCLFAHNPVDEGNIRANFEYVEACDSTFLRICHFPNNSLLINHDEDIVVPICNGWAWGELDSHLIDCNGDLIMKYYTMGAQGGLDIYMVRVGLEGTLKQQSLLFENNFDAVPRFGAFSESPLRYYQWRYHNVFDDHLAIDIIDSLLHWDNTIIINKIINEHSISDSTYLVAYDHFIFNHQTEVIPIGGNDILVAARYASDTNFDALTAEFGVAVAKYDIRTMQRKGVVFFNDYQGPSNEAQCLGLKKTVDGAVYFLYKEDGYPTGNIVAVKMDTNLNMDWKRIMKTEDIDITSPLQFPILYEGGQDDLNGIAWVGHARKYNSEKSDLFYFFLNHDGTVGVNESGIEVRPYSYYPNPAHDQLHLQYSPDVEPKLVELYDLQGRLVRTQRNGLESIDMSQLPTGTYTMRVTLEDGKCFTDRVVKE
ncbi:MAG: T9SS type A sorting domain-containing protein [Bacteroidales bacterium]|nr:T9SS type A sorting domain-containing protein [Bacteroidales bacterium]